MERPAPLLMVAASGLWKVGADAELRNVGAARFVSRPDMSSFNRGLKSAMIHRLIQFTSKFLKSFDKTAKVKHSYQTFDCAIS